MFFEIWKAEDKTAFLSYITNSIEKPDFPIVKFISCHIDNTQDGGDFLEFLRLFECKELIANKLKSVMTTEDMKNPSIALFCKNCGTDDLVKI